MFEKERSMSAVCIEYPTLNLIINFILLFNQHHFILGTADNGTYQQDKTHRWPYGVVPYLIQPTIDSAIRATIVDAMADFHSKTCIKWVSRIDQESYVHFVAGNSCRSVIGRVGSAQEIVLGPQCRRKAVVIHEMLHALGFDHEHNRPDRDRYVTIMWHNIKKEHIDEFKVSTFTKGNDLPYDYNSVMHYERHHYSKDPGKLDTIVPKQTAKDSIANEYLGSRDSFSDIDLMKIRRFYECLGNKSLAAQLKPNCRSEGGQTFQDGEQVRGQRFVMRCRAFLDGTGYLVVEACLTGSGAMVRPGQRYVENSFLHECKLNTNGVSGAVVIIGCVAGDGSTRSIGEKWSVENFVYACQQLPGKEDGEFSVGPIGCHPFASANHANFTQDRHVIPFGCYRLVGWRQYVSCWSDQYTGKKHYKSDTHPAGFTEPC